MLGLAPRRLVQRRVLSTTSLLRLQKKQAEEVDDPVQDSAGFKLVKEAIAPFQGKKRKDGSRGEIPFGSEEYKQRVRFIRESAELALYEWMIYKNHQSRNLAEITHNLQEAFPAEALQDSGVDGTKLVASKKRTQHALENFQKALEEGREHVLDLPHQASPELHSDSFKQFREDMATKSASELKLETELAETSLKQDWIAFESRLSDMIGDLDRQAPGLTQRLAKVSQQYGITSTSEEMDEPIDLNDDSERPLSLDPTAKPTAVPTTKAPEKPTAEAHIKGGYKILKEQAKPAMTLAQMRQRVTERK